MPIIQLLAILLALIPGLARASGENSVLQYDLKAGDHLIYDQTLDYHTRSSRTEVHIQATWQNHLLVMDTIEGAAMLGIQRNRSNVEMIGYKEDGANRLAAEKNDFQQRVLTAPTRFSEANEILPDGTARLPWSVNREAITELIYGIHEIEPLPQRVLEVGDTWKGKGSFPFEYQFVGWKVVDNQRLAEIEGNALDDGLAMTLWFSPALGLLHSLHFRDERPLPGGGHLRESFTLTLNSRNRDESVTTWIQNPSTRLAVLNSMTISDWLPSDTTFLESLLEDEDPVVVRQVLSLIYRNYLAPPTLFTLRRLYEFSNPRVRSLVIRLLESFAKDEVHDLLETALKDPDPFVQNAVLLWTQSRLPLDQAIQLTRENWESHWSHVAAYPIENPVSAVASAGTPSCMDEQHWSIRHELAQKFPAQPPSTTLRGMRSQELNGWPYVVHIPEDYRGDEPFPLVIYLGGGAGRAAAAIPGSYKRVAETGYLVVYPQAKGWWWSPQSMHIVSTLLQEILRSFNVDHNRVYVTGLSNGGTGTLMFASLEPSRIAAAAPMMGAGVFVSDGRPPELDNLVNIPLLFLHGEKDEVIHPMATRDTVRRLMKTHRTASVEMQILANRGHDLWFNSDEGWLIPFFEAHRRQPFPTDVAIATRSKTYSRNGWLEITAGSRLVSARALGHIDDNNTIHLSTKKVDQIRVLLRKELLPAGPTFRIILNDKLVFEGRLQEDCAVLEQSWWDTADPYLAWSMAVELSGRP